jgi:protein arginine kinase activator
MVCNVCKKNVAKVHLTQIVGDKVQKVDLCEDCAKEKGVNDPSSFSLADLLLGLGAAQEIEQSAGGVEIKCARCGFTQAEFKKMGRLGCPDCYETFAQGLEGLLKTMHKGTRHVGKVPRVLRESRDVEERLNGLLVRLDKAVAEEDFEQAAVLRDEIKQMRSRTGSLSSP